jgi:hypothetical protein
MNWKKIFVGAGIGGGLIAGITYLRRLKRTSVELETISTVNVYKIDLKGITLRVDVQIKNPTKTKFKIKFPFVKLLYKNAMVGSSEVVNQDITIPAFGQAVAEKIMIQIPIMGIFSLGSGLIKDLGSGDPVKMNVNTVTTIDLGWKKIPYSKTEEVTLKK